MGGDTLECAKVHEKSCAVQNSMVVTIAGSLQTDGLSWNGPALSVALNGPRGMCFADQTETSVVIADCKNQRIRRVHPVGVEVDVKSGKIETLTEPKLNGSQSDSKLQMCAATAACVDFKELRCILRDEQHAGGGYYVADDYKVRYLDLSSQTIMVTDVVGGIEIGEKDAVGAAARFNGVSCLACGKREPTILYAADTNNNRICRIDTKTLAVTTLIGATASVKNPRTLAFGRSDRDSHLLYITCLNGLRVFNVRTNGFQTIDVDVPNAKLDPRGLEVLPNGQIVVSCMVTRCLWLVTPPSAWAGADNDRPRPERIAGKLNDAGSADGDALENATFTEPKSLLLSLKDRCLYISDYLSKRIRRMTLPPHLFIAADEFVKQQLDQATTYESRLKALKGRLVASWTAEDVEWWYREHLTRVLPQYRLNILTIAKDFSGRIGCHNASGGSGGSGGSSGRKVAVTGESLRSLRQQEILPSDVSIGVMSAIEIEVQKLNLSPFALERLTEGEDSKHRASTIQIIPIPFAHFGPMEPLTTTNFSHVASTTYRGENVVVKFWTPSEHGPKYDLKCWVSEYQTIWALNHPRIIRLLAACDNSLSVEHKAGTKFSGLAPEKMQHALILERLAGGTLYKWRENIVTSGSDGSQFAEAIRLLLQTAEGIEVMHSHAIAHRDIKPQNVLLTSTVNGDAKLCDFGLARFVSSHNSVMTTKPEVGTLKYMAPEQLEAGKLTPACDIYGFGGVMYYLLYGVDPWHTLERYEQVFACILRGQTPPPPAVYQSLVGAGAGGDSKMLVTTTAIEADLIALMYDCLKAAPLKRPSISTIIAQLKQFHVRSVGTGATAAASLAAAGGNASAPGNTAVNVASGRANSVLIQNPQSSTK